MIFFFFGFAASRMTYEIQAFMKEKELNPLKNLMVPLIQVSFQSCKLGFLTNRYVFVHSGASVYEFFLCLERYGQCSGREYAVRRIVLVFRSYHLRSLLHSSFVN